MKTYSISTITTNTKTGKVYKKEVGVLIEKEHENGKTYKYLHLYMFPDTSFQISNLYKEQQVEYDNDIAKSSDQ